MAGPAAAQRLAPPTYRVPGASVAARASAAAGAGTGPLGGGPRQEEAASGQGRGLVTPPSTSARDAPATPGDGKPSGAAADADASDGEGFQPVRRRGWRKARGSAGRDDARGADTDGDSDGGQGGAAGTQEEDPDPGDDAGPPSPRTLHRAWQNEVTVVRRLKGQGLAGDHPAMQAACAARDEAERMWREAKDPVPPAIRLARAQAKLDRALEAQGESHRALCQYEAEHATRLAALRAKLEEDRAKVQFRRQQLEEVQDEVGAEGKGARARARQGAAARQVHTTLSTTVAPALAALVEQLDSSTPAWGVLNGLLGTLAESQSALESAFSPGPAAQTFDLTGGEEEGGVEDRGDDADGWGGSEWSESHELLGSTEAAGPGKAPAPAPRQQAAHLAEVAATPSQWQRQGYGDGGASQPMDMDDWWGAPYADWQGATRWQACGHGKWSRTSWADAHEQEQAGTHMDGDQPPAARRRLEPAPAPGGGNEGAAPAGGTADDAQGRRAHESRVQRVVLAAIEAGIQPITQAGEELQLLDARQLDDWIAEHFPAGAHA